MPPKKDNKKEVQLSEDDGTGMPKSIVTFTVQFTIEHTNPENLAVMFEWFNQSGQTERVDTGILEQWSQVDEHTASFEKQFDAVRVDEGIVRLLTTHQFYVYVVNTEDMKVLQEITLDYSQLLTSTRNFKYQNSKMKVLPIENFCMEVSADKELLQQVFKEYLNPLEIEVIGAKDLPLFNDKNYEPVYASYKFFDGTTHHTQSLLSDSKLRWNNKHVILLGHLDQHQLKEQLKTQLFKVEIHNRDELLDNTVRQETNLFDIEGWVKVEEEKNKPPTPVDDPKGKKGKKEEKKEPPKKEAKKDNKKKDVKLGEPVKDEGPVLEYNRNNYGIAAYYLCDLLKSHVRQIKLQAPIIPRKQYEDLESTNLDLNTTARKNLPNIFKSANYLDNVHVNNAFLLIGIKIGTGIGTFKMPEMEQKPAEEEKKGAKKPPSQEKEKKPAVEKKEEVEDLPAIFERAVYIMPYKSKDFVAKLQKAFYDINMECFQLEEGGLRAIRTKALAEDEKNSRQLDYLDGFEIIDNEFRMFVIEGISTGAMAKLEKMVPRLEPNNEHFKILKNFEIRFKSRMYTYFHVEIKRIRLRENLKQLLMNPDLYIRTKVPENVQETLVKISNILKQWNIRTVGQFDLFPLATDLIAVERKYSDSLSDEDIFGFDQGTKRAKKVKGTQDLNSFTESKVNTTTVRFQEPVHSKEQGQEEEEGNRKQKSQVKYKSDKESYTLQMRAYRAVEGKTTYSGCKNNDYEEQLLELRERVQKDKNNFYTYSQEYLSLSIDPHDVRVEARKEKERNEKLEHIDGRGKFRSIIPRNKQEWAHHPKQPPQCILDDIAQNPWYEQRKLKIEMDKPTKGLKAFKDGEKMEFNPYIGRIGVFSLPEVRAEEIISPAEKEREEREKKKQEQDAFLKKCLGATYFYIRARTFNPGDQIDKNNGLLEDKAKKKGLMVTNTQIKNSGIDLKKRVENPPSSIFHNEEFKVAVDPFTRKMDPKKVGSELMFDNYQEPEILTKTFVHKPLRQVPY